MLSTHRLQQFLGLVVFFVGFFVNINVQRKYSKKILSDFLHKNTDSIRSSLVIKESSVLQNGRYYSVGSHIFHAGTDHTLVDRHISPETLVRGGLFISGGAVHNSSSEEQNITVHFCAIQFAACCWGFPASLFLPLQNIMAGKLL